MTRIHITPEQVRQASSQFKQASTQSWEMIARLQNTMSSLQPDWEGMTQQRFYQEFSQWQTSMRQFAELLDNIGLQLDAVAPDLNKPTKGVELGAGSGDRGASLACQRPNTSLTGSPYNVLRNA
jgi:WXG100 family type VII secretion target